jgi:hypothetical protein
MGLEPGAVEGMMADYRASKPGGLDAQLDEKDQAEGKKISIPMRILWGTKGIIGRLKPEEAWRERCEAGMYQGGQGVDSSHYIPGRLFLFTWADSHSLQNIYRKQSYRKLSISSHEICSFRSNFKKCLLWSVGAMVEGRRRLRDGQHKQFRNINMSGSGSDPDDLFRNVPVSQPTSSIIKGSL